MCLGEYDLKTMGDHVVVNHSSLLFSHSVEKGTLIFRPTRLSKACELGINCVAEAGAQLQGSRLFSGQVAHNTTPEKAILSRAKMLLPSETLVEVLKRCIVYIVFRIIYIYL